MNEQQANSDALLSDIRRLQEKLYSKEEDYTYKIPVEHQETWGKIEDLVEVKRRYDEIMNADTNGAMEALKELLKYSWSSESLSETDRNVFLLFHKIIRNALLKAQENQNYIFTLNDKFASQELTISTLRTELAELKKKVIEIANEVDKKQVNWLSVAVCFQELRELCEAKK